MNDRELLKTLIDEAQTALASADSGGEREHAFNLMADREELGKALDFVESLNTRIDDEVFKRNTYWRGARDWRDGDDGGEAVFRTI